MTDREKVLAWLDWIGEDDAECREEVFAHCRESIESRKYYVGRWETRSSLDKRPIPLTAPAREPMLDRKSMAAGDN